VPKKFDFGNGEVVPAAPPPSPVRRGKAFDFPEATAPVEEAAPPRRGKSFDFSNLPAEIPTPAEPKRQPKVIVPEGRGEVRYQRAARERTLTDALMDKARTIAPGMQIDRLRGRIDQLLVIDMEALTKWGDLNLLPLQQASGVQADIAAKLQSIDAVGRLKEAHDAVCRPVTFFDRVAGRKPEHYEQSLATAKRGLQELMLKSEAQRREFEPEVIDLHLDAIALSVTLTEFSNPSMGNIANSRTKTLLLAHQTGTMLLQVLTNTIEQCATFLGQIDSLINVTIPQWKLSQR
jgi:hypothetical protein